MNKPANTVGAYCDMPLYRRKSLIERSKKGLFFCSREHQIAASRSDSGILITGLRSGKENFRKQVPVRCLGFCGKDFRPFRLANGYCSSCQYIERWLLGKETGTTKLGEISEVVRKYIRFLKGEQCWNCGWAEVNPYTGKIPVQVDHIDGDSSNNALDKF